MKATLSLPLNLVFKTKNSTKDLNNGAFLETHVPVHSRMQPINAQKCYLCSLVSATRSSNVRQQLPPLNHTFMLFWQPCGIHSTAVSPECSVYPGKAQATARRPRSTYMCLLPFARWQQFNAANKEKSCSCRGAVSVNALRALPAKLCSGLGVTTHLLPVLMCSNKPFTINLDVNIYNKSESQGQNWRCSCTLLWLRGACAIGSLSSVLLAQW